MSNRGLARLAGEVHQAAHPTLRRVMDATDKVLASKGFTKTDPGRADFLVAIQPGDQDQIQYTT